MKLLSINISQAVEVSYNDKIISTGIFKKPISDSVDVNQRGLLGDQQVDLINHGGEHKAVYGFSANHYDYWRKKLDNPNLFYGQFGENLTITDLDEASLCIGDRLQIGNCILEITQPRVPCFKLGIALSLSTMPKLFVQSASTGIYFRVLHVGSIANGSLVERIDHHPKQLSVQTLFKAYFDKQFVDANKVLKIARDIPELSDEWRQKVLARL